MSESKHIAFFMISLHLGGGERMMIDLANSFAKEGHTVDMVLARKEGELLASLNPAVRIISLDAVKLISAVPKLAAYFRTAHPHAFIASSEYAHLIALVARIIARYKGKVVLRVGITISESFSRYPKLLHRIAVPFLIRMLYPQANEIISISGDVKDDLVHNVGIPDTLVRIVYNPKHIDVIAERSLETPQHPWFTKSPPLIVSVGRLRPQKDFETLIKAFSLLRKKHTVRLAILGTGSERERLVALSQELGVADDIAFLGFIENPYPWMRIGVASVSSSRWEGLAGTIIESLAVGAPTVVTDCPGGSREIVAPEIPRSATRVTDVHMASGGILVPTGNPEKMAEALARLVADPQLQKEYAEKARERSRAFSWEPLFAMYKEILLSN